MKTYIDPSISQSVADSSLILARSTSSDNRSWVKLNCLEKCIYKTVFALARAIATVSLTLFLAVESLYYSVKGLLSWSWELITCHCDFSNGTNHVITATKRFFHIWIAPLSFFFPETILQYLVSDEIIMREPYEKAYDHFKTWDHERQVAAWNYAIEHEEKIDPKFFEKLKSRDVGDVWEDINLKLFYQRFSFRDEFDTLTSNQWSVPSREICKSLQKWGSTQDGKPHKDKLKKTIELFTFSLEKDYRGGVDLKYGKIGKTDWVYSPSGFSGKDSGPGHANGYLVTPDLIAKIDTGTGKQRGIKFYKIREKNHEALEEFVKNLHNDSREQISRKEQRNIFHKAKKTFALEKIGVFSWSQKSGSCIFTAPLISALGIMVLQELYQESDFSKETVKTAIKSTLPTFKKWYQWDRVESFKDIFHTIKHKKNFTKIISAIITDCIEERDFTTLEQLLTFLPQLKDYNLSNNYKYLFNAYPNLTLYDFVRKNRTIKIPLSVRQTNYPVLG